MSAEPGSTHGDGWWHLLPMIRDLVRPYRGSLTIGFALILIGRISALSVPTAMKILIDSILLNKRGGMVLPVVAGVLAAVVIQNLAAYLLSQILSKSTQRLVADLRCKVQAHVVCLPVSFHDSHKTGSLISRIMSDVEVVQFLIGNRIVVLAGGTVAGLLSFVILVRISALMTLFATALILLFATVLRARFTRARKVAGDERKIYSEVSGRLAETLGGVRFIKGYHAEAREAAAFAAASDRLLGIRLEEVDAWSSTSLWTSLLAGVLTATIIGIGARLVLAGQIRIGDFVMYTVLVTFLIAPVEQVVTAGAELTGAFAALDRIRQLLEQPREEPSSKRTIAMPAIVGDVRFDGVSFEYTPGKRVLHQITFRAEPGSITALVGPSGSGKSTIVGLIAAFANPQEGVVTVDGIDLSTARLGPYRTQLGIVLQDTFLFDSTIRENVAFARPGASEIEIQTACSLSHVSEFAEAFPDGYDTRVGERGVKLSVGQRQRISIARAILANPRILILDEATSSLDSESEQFIQQGLSCLLRGRTTFVIAHRLSTIRKADQILVIERGRIAELGTHDALYAQRGRYWHFHTTQHALHSLEVPPPDPSGGDRRNYTTKFNIY